MKETNSFKLMQEQDKWNHPLPPDIEQSVLGSLKLLQLLGDTMDLYLPKVFEMFLLTLGGTLRELDTPDSTDPALPHPTHTHDPDLDD